MLAINLWSVNTCQLHNYRPNQHHKKVRMGDRNWGEGGEFKRETEGHGGDIMLGGGGVSWNQKD